MFTNLLLGNRFSLHKFLQFLDIIVTVKCNAVTFTTVPAGPSCLLVIAFQAFGDVKVDHKSHIRFINPHTECNGSHDHIDFLHQELILVGGAGG